jgi:hypothetical protein
VPWELKCASLVQMKRKLIKDFTSVHTGKKKMYILAGLEPSKELTGGNWYTNGDLDLDLVEVCTKMAHKFFEQREKSAREKGMPDRWRESLPPSHTHARTHARTDMYSCARIPYTV